MNKISNLSQKILINFACIVFILEGCAGTQNKRLDQQKESAICAANWKHYGYNFDPNVLTCLQMYEKVRAIRQAQKWKQKGYNFDPNSMTADEMEVKAKDIDRAKYWQKKGYNFDPFKMTANEMNKKAEVIDEVKYWEQHGYYYDPNTKKVYLSKDMKKELGSLAGLHGTYVVSQVIGIRNPLPSPIMTFNSGKIYNNLGSGHWIKENIDRGKFILLEDHSLWQVDPLDDITSWLWLRMADITVTESDDIVYPYLLVNTEDGEAVKAKLISK